jgi:hypothetical protein
VTGAIAALARTAAGDRARQGPAHLKPARAASLGNHAAVSRHLDRSGTIAAGHHKAASIDRSSGSNGWGGIGSNWLGRRRVQLAGAVPPGCAERVAVPPVAGGLPGHARQAGVRRHRRAGVTTKITRSAGAPKAPTDTTRKIGNRHVSAPAAPPRSCVVASPLRRRVVASPSLPQAGPDLGGLSCRRVVAFWRSRADRSAGTYDANDPNDVTNPRPAGLPAPR